MKETNFLTKLFPSSSSAAAFDSIFICLFCFYEYFSSKWLKRYRYIQMKIYSNETFFTFCCLKCAHKNEDQRKYKIKHKNQKMMWKIFFAEKRNNTLFSQVQEYLSALYLHINYNPRNMPYLNCASNIHLFIYLFSFFFYLGCW